MKVLFRWSPAPNQQLLKSLVGGFAMGIPLFFAMYSHQLNWGLMVCTGCLVMSDAELHEHWYPQFKTILFLFSSILAAALLCLLLQYFIVDPTLRQAALVMSIFVLVSVAHYSMPFALWVTRLSIYAIMMSGMLLALNSQPETVIPLLLGALWMGGVMLLSSVGLSFYHNYRKSTSVSAKPVEVKTRVITHVQRLEHWFRSFSTTHTWKYPVRLLLCLSCTWVLQYLWPSHHFQWSALTVGILLQRNPEGGSVKALQRGLGTVFGVMVASVFLYFQPHHYVLLVFISVLAGLRVFLKPCNYLFYTVSMTPLMMLILSSQEELYSSTILWDRLMATLVAVVLVFAANFCIRPSNRSSSVS